MTSPADFMSNGHEVLTGDIVPFGKYKGRATAELAADDRYRDWVLAQPWVRERYVNFWNVLVQGSPVSQDSPEHNEMQAKFLDPAWCTRLMRLWPGLSGEDGLGYAVDKIAAWQKRNPAPPVSAEYALVPAQVTGIEFEHAGWDVHYHYESASITQSWTCACDTQYDFTPPEPGSFEAEDWRNERKKPREPAKPYAYKPPEPFRQQPWAPLGNDPWSIREAARLEAEYQERVRLYPEQLAKYKQDLAAAEAKHQQELASYPECLAEYQRQRHYALSHGPHENHFEQPGVPCRIAAELKPDLGDDYPAVLRQVKGYMTQRVPVDGYSSRNGYVTTETADAFFTVARRAQFRSVTWDQVRQVFAASGIILVREDALLSA